MARLGHLALGMAAARQSGDREPVSTCFPRGNAVLAGPIVPGRCRHDRLCPPSACGRAALAIPCISELGRPGVASRRICIHAHVCQWKRAPRRAPGAHFKTSKMNSACLPTDLLPPPSATGWPVSATRFGRCEKRRRLIHESRVVSRSVSR
jgi:hypothetical protein